MSPVFLNVSEVLSIHQDQIQRYGGDFGIRDLGLLESVVAMPSAGFADQYLHRDLFEMAAAYFFHIVQNRPFVDGNNRTGTASALTFLEINHVDFNATEDDLVKLVIAVTHGQADKSAVAEFFGEYSIEPS